MVFGHPRQVPILLAAKTDWTIRTILNIILRSTGQTQFLAGLLNFIFYEMQKEKTATFSAMCTTLVVGGTGVGARFIRHDGVFCPGPYLSSNQIFRKLR
jgi:heme/copper-type cytochrome/quinol oxidase subunit 4